MLDLQQSYIKKNTYKFIILKFWIGGGVIEPSVSPLKESCEIVHETQQL